jgi:hypothetical protein
MEPKKIASPSCSFRLLKTCSHREAVLPNSLPKRFSSTDGAIHRVKAKKWLH